MDTDNHEWWQDTQDIERCVRAVYACISGPAGAPRDWARFRYLQHPNARSLRTVVEADGSTHAMVFDVDSYIANVEAFFAQNDFFEVEIDRRVQRFGQVAHVWSLYEARPTADSPVLLKRGANSVQLCHEHGRWWVFSTIWDNEREGLKFDLW
ncbi:MULTISPECIES: hypothetical protein [unclassified Lysobacter]|uniref:hypothetical protein n=1 Tax=unclassified Lysobacter TaxID=2635362 RepID=UPI0006FA3895|nr:MULTISPECIES: hypothetical protein [unclassified Lysobacter]KRA20456.1 hypothetical protein ASD69_03705 [Lysobacter sp. Root604]KRD39473.1 hypothetical protein ASE35_03720 [Lysobacter sp. Root916]KRD79444.1 hypothetical protein ASE43_00500 [Lysobacter sp. Root983]SFK67437.1 hypothetical protein SAMN04487938_1550 [Lysobacter sp. cf310]